MRAYEQCANPDRTYSAAAFWFINGRLDKDRMIEQMDAMKEQGVYQAFLHPRAYLVTPYLEKEWWDAIGACVEHAAHTGFLSWLYDEYAWPSGTAGSTFEFGFQKPSRVLAQGRVNMAKSAWLCLCAVNHATVYVNGVCVLDADSCEQPLTCDIREACARATT